MLTLWAAQVESSWDKALPVEVKQLPADLAELDRGRRHAKRWTAAGMLVAEQQFRPIIGYRDLAKLVTVIYATPTGSSLPTRTLSLLLTLRCQKSLLFDCQSHVEVRRRRSTTIRTSSPTAKLTS